MSDDTSSCCSESLSELWNNDNNNDGDSRNDDNDDGSVKSFSPSSEIWNDVKNGNDVHTECISDVWNFKLGLLFHGE